MTTESCPTCGGPLDEQTGVCDLCVTHAKTPSGAPPSAGPHSPAEAGAPSIPGYTITSKIGEGGMGALYLAEETSLGRRVAIKVISHRIAGDANSTARFLREARTLATIEHSHVVRVYSFGEVNGTPYLVMEYVEGETLAERLARVGRLPADEALRMTRQIVEALEAAWERKIVHRDIKPSNILIDRRNQVRVADFGLAKPAHEEVSDFSLTHSNTLVGTPHYVSPEQAQGKDVDFRSDVYSLGIMLYQMLTGDRPFVGSTPVAVIAKHLHEPLPKLADPTIDQLVRKMAEKSPDQRHVSYAELRTDIDAVEHRLQPVTATVPLKPALDRRPAVRMPLIYFAAVAIPLAVLFAVTKKIPPRVKDKPREGRLVVAVAPFYGPDDDSAREGKVMAALIEREIGQKLGSDNVRLVGIDETKKPLRSQEEARAFAESVNANAVIWGDAFALRSETEIQPHVTILPLVQKTADAKEQNEPHAYGTIDDASMLRDRGGATLKLQAQAPDQIELRRTSASGVGDVITLLAGINNLTRHEPQRALDLFQKAPQTAETLRYEVQALLMLEKIPDAKSMLERAIALDPNDAASHALLGDLLVGQKNIRDAYTEYAKASALKTPFHTQRGIAANGRVYIRETYNSKKITEGKETDTPYLIGIDPANEHVVERYFMPGVPQSFESLPDGFVVCMNARDDKTDKIAFRNGKFERTLWLTPELVERMRGLKTASTVIANFSDQLSGIRTFNDGRSHAKLAPSPQMDDDAPKTLPDLEAALRAREERDPTMPYTPLFLALTLDAEGRHAEAEAKFNEMMRRDYNVPYFEYSWMLTYLERMRKDAWSDALFKKAVEARRRMPEPVSFSTMIDLLIDANFSRQAACNADITRGYTIFTRTPQITGIVTEALPMAHAAWAKYFRERGDVVDAEREKHARDSVSRQKMNVYGVAAKLDYAVAFLTGAFGAYVTIMVAIFFTAFRRARLMSHQTPPRLPKWIDVAVCALSAIALAWYVAARMHLLSVPAVIVTLLLGILTALMVHARTADGLTLFDVVAAIRRSERALLIAAFAVLVVAGSIAAWRTAISDAVAQTPVALGDAAGHPYVVRQVEKIMASHQRPSAGATYLAALANHYAGNTDRARVLYAKISTPAAAANLQALNERKMPAVPLTADDVYDALAPSSIADVVANITQSHPNLPFMLVLLTIPIALLAVARAREESAATEEPRVKLAGKIAFTLVPGTYDMATAKWWRAWAIYFAIGAVTLPILAIATARAGQHKELRIPAVGPATTDAITNFDVAIPMPYDAQHARPFAYAMWSFRMSLPYAGIFWILLVALIAFVLASHLRRIPRIMRSASRDPDEVPTVITSSRDRSIA